MKHKLAILEMLRGAAASYVVAGHVFIPALGLRGAAALPLLFGQEAVIAFFLLSGFVIYYSTHGHRDQSFRGYFLRRFLRIYPVFLLALVLSCTTEVLRGYPLVPWREIAGNALMLQDFSLGKPGVWFNACGGNVPLWSLSYEWWFYLLFFPLYKYVPPRWQLPVVAALSTSGLATFALWPNQASLFLMYFILWWTGLELARAYTDGVRPTPRNQRKLVLVLGGMCALVGGVLLFGTERPARLSPGMHPLLEIRHFAAGFVLLCGGLLWSQLRWRGFAAIFGVFALLAPISYAIYVFHFPLWKYLSEASWVPGGTAGRVAVTLLLTLILAWIAEGPFQRAVNRLARNRESRPSTGLAPAES